MPKHDLQCLKFRLNWRHQLLTIFVFLLTTACNPRSKYYPQCESKPKYYNSFKLPNRLVGYNNYDQARLCAKKNNKPLAIYFTGYACVNCEAFENDFLNAASVASHLNNHFIFVQLYVDDKTLLPLKDQYEMNIDHTNKKRKIRTIGDLNISLLKKYPHSSHPSLFITNKMDSVVALINYNPNSEELINEFNLALNGLNLKN